MIDAAAVIAALRVTDARSGGSRVAWTEAWAREREQLDALAVAISPQVLIERDAFANTWYVLPGAGEETVLIGSHSDCVPGGGWLDGILGVHAGLGVLAAVAGRPREERPRTLAVVDWADEEGTRFDRSLLGSSAATAALTGEELDGLTAQDGVPAREVIDGHGFDAAALGAPTPRLAQVCAAVELHIEQGPTLERAGRAVAAVAGCLGVRRSRVAFHGTAGHAGSVAMAARADPVADAARFISELFTEAERHDGLATVGRLRATPEIVSAVPADCRLSLDLRHADPASLARLEDRAHALLERARCEIEHVSVYRDEPVRFDPVLVEAAARVAGGGAPVYSGPQHDSAALARAGIPTAMLFTASTAGISHARGEDTPEADLAAGIVALDRLVGELLHAGGGR